MPPSPVEPGRLPRCPHGHTEAQATPCVPWNNHMLTPNSELLFRTKHDLTFPLTGHFVLKQMLTGEDTPGQHKLFILVAVAAGSQCRSLLRAVTLDSGVMGAKGQVGALGFLCGKCLLRACGTVPIHLQDVPLARAAREKSQVCKAC